MATSCRVCQRDDGARTIDVASLSEESGLSISLMLSYCAQVEVSNGEQICSECLMNLETAFNFRKQCRQTSAPATPHAGSTDQKPFQCCVPCCIMTATSMRDLVLHSTKLHRVERATNTAQQKTELVSTSCPICCVGFASVCAMKNHSETQNIQWTKLKCDKCQMVCQNTVKYAEHRVERCTGVPVEAVGEDHAMECDNENTCDLDGKIKRAMQVVKTGKRFMIKLTESEVHILTETSYPLLGQLEELLASYDETSKIFYVCGTCGFQSLLKNYILQHIATSHDCHGFYHALKSFDPTQEEPWLSCASCHFVATNPISIMQHQNKDKHSGIKSVPPQSSKPEPAPETEQCIEIGESIKVETPQITAKVKPHKSSSHPVTKRVIPKAPGKMKPHRPRPEKKHETLLCRCGLMFTQQTLLSRHMDYYCQRRFEPISPAPAQQKVKNVLQCDGCLRILRSPSDVARHQQNTCPAYRKQRLGARYSASAAEL
uniref:(northern house mosquito) hypothetical protein n=1 Tax=Culex pipiens TaxID=7175 RepID=A0A8D8AHD6_CULPI